LPLSVCIRSFSTPLVGASRAAIVSGAIQDVYLDPSDTLPIASRAFDGLSLTSVEVTFRGRCRSCSDQ